MKTPISCKGAFPAAIAVPPRLVESKRAGGWLLVLSFLTLAVGGAVLYVFNPGEWGFYPFCFFHRATGLLCPGCGSLRAMHQLLHGHATVALRFNAVFVLSLPLLGWCGARVAVGKLRHKPVSYSIRPAWWWTGLTVLVIFGILRNMPFAHRLWLAP